MVHFLSIAGHEQEMSLEKLNEIIPILLDNAVNFHVRTERKA